MVKDRIVLSQETSCHKPADRPAQSQRRLAADPSSLQTQTKLRASRLHCLHHRGFIYIMAAGGAGSGRLRGTPTPFPQSRRIRRPRIQGCAKDAHGNCLAPAGRLPRGGLFRGRLPVGRRRLRGPARIPLWERNPGPGLVAGWALAGFRKPGSKRPPLDARRGR